MAGFSPLLLTSATCFPILNLNWLNCFTCSHMSHIVSLLTKYVLPVSSAKQRQGNSQEEGVLSLFQLQILFCLQHQCALLQPHLLPFHSPQLRSDCTQRDYLRNGGSPSAPDPCFLGGGGKTEAVTVSGHCFLSALTALWCTRFR